MRHCDFLRNMLNDSNGRIKSETGNWKANKPNSTELTRKTVIIRSGFGIWRFPNALERVKITKSSLNFGRYNLLTTGND